MPAYKYTNSTNKTLWFAQFYFQDWDGSRKLKKKRGFLTKKEAQQWEREFLERVQGTPDMTFGALCELYFEDAKKRLKPTTYSRKEYNRIKPEFPSLSGSTCRYGSTKTVKKH